MKIIKEMALKIIYVVLIIAIFFNITSCLSVPMSENQTGVRTLILGGKEVSSDIVGRLISWYCKDYVREGQILVEVGFFEKADCSSVGFVLYDGGNTGDFTYYERQGLEHHWSWGENYSQYRFVIKQDGTGLYYDFTGVEKGTAVKPKAVYKAYKR